MIRCPRCRAKTRVLETRATSSSVRRRRGCSVKSCAGKVTTIEVVVRDGHPSLLAKGCLVVPSRQIAKLREILTAVDISEARRFAQLQKIVAAIERTPL